MKSVPSEHDLRFFVHIARQLCESGDYARTAIAPVQRIYMKILGISIGVFFLVNGLGGSGLPHDVYALLPCIIRYNSLLYCNVIARGSFILIN